MSKSKTTSQLCAPTESDLQLAILIHQMITTEDQSIRHAKAAQLKAFQESPVDYVKKLTALICSPSLSNYKKDSLAIHVNDFNKDKIKEVNKVLEENLKKNQLESSAISTCEHDLQEIQAMTKECIRACFHESCESKCRFNLG